MDGPRTMCQAMFRLGAELGAERPVAGFAKAAVEHRQSSIRVGYAKDESVKEGIA